MERPAFGIYLNRASNKVVRANSPSAIPSGEEWVIVTPEVNMTLLNIRKMAGERGLSADPDSIIWDWGV